jgi:hypothetical protein
MVNNAPISCFEAKFRANYGKLVVLERFKGFMHVGVEYDTRGVDHAGSKEPINT